MTTNTPSPHPVWTLVRKELRESFRDGRFRLLAASVLLLLAAGLAAGWLDTRDARQRIETARAADHATWIGQGPRNPHSAAHFGHYAFKPRPVLSALDRGVDDYLGSAVWLEAHWQDPFALRPAEDRTALQRFGELSAAFTLQVLAPLLVIFAGFATFAGERERGTLLQLASLGLDAKTLALGKAGGLAAALALVLGPAVLLGTGVALLTGAGAADSGLLGGLLLAGAYGAYLAVLLALVVAASAWARSARGALVALLGFWMLTTLIVPRLVADVAERAYPIPTPRAFFTAIAEDEEQGVDGLGSRAERRQALQAEALAKHGAESLDQLPVSFAALSLQASEEHSNRVFDKHYGDLWRRYAGQEQLHLWGTVLSPRLAVRSLSMAIAGTDVTHHRHFADAAEEHRRKLVKFLNDDMAYNASGADFGYLADKQLWEASPTFSYEPPALGEVLAGQAPALGGLAAWLVLAAGLAMTATGRLRVLPGESTT